MIQTNYVTETLTPFPAVIRDIFTYTFVSKSAIYGIIYFTFK